MRSTRQAGCRGSAAQNVTTGRHARHDDTCKFAEKCAGRSTAGWVTRGDTRMVCLDGAGDLSGGSGNKRARRCGARADRKITYVIPSRGKCDQTVAGAIRLRADRPLPRDSRPRDVSAEERLDRRRNTAWDLSRVLDVTDTIEVPADPRRLEGSDVHLMLLTQVRRPGRNAHRRD